MGIRTTLNGVTFTANETAVVSAAGQDAAGTLEFAAQALADAIEKLTWLTTAMPAGANKTTLLSQITSLT